MFKLFRLEDRIRSLIKTDNSHLEQLAKYYFTKNNGKQIRPLLVLLVAQATQTKTSEHDVNKSISPALTSFEKHESIMGVLPSQHRLAEITELIHTASLLHDDVIDEAETRRGKKSVNAVMGNKLAVLAGDFLLARASMALVRLRNPEVTELIASILSDLVDGEFMRPTELDLLMQKSFLKTASLFAKSCRASAILGGASDQVVLDAFEYGKNVGLAFQLIDDLLDVTSTSEKLGKPAQSDLKLGLATAPVIFAAREYPELEKMIKSKFNHETATELIFKSQGLQKTKLLAEHHVNLAINAITNWPESNAKKELKEQAENVLK